MMWVISYFFICNPVHTVWNTNKPEPEFVNMCVPSDLAWKSFKAQRPEPNTRVV